MSRDTDLCALWGRLAHLCSTNSYCALPECVGTMETESWHTPTWSMLSWDRQSMERDGNEVNTGWKYNNNVQEMLWGRKWSAAGGNNGGFLLRGWSGEVLLGKRRCTGDGRKSRNLQKSWREQGCFPAPKEVGVAGGAKAWEPFWGWGGRGPRAFWSTEGFKWGVDLVYIFADSHLPCRDWIRAGTRI